MELRGKLSRQTIGQIFHRRLKELESKGYAVTEAEVSYVLAWRPPEEAEEVAVCLANLVMKKHKL